MAVSLLKILVTTMLIIIAIGLGFSAAYASNLIAKCPDIKDVDVSPEGFMSKVYDVNGNEIETLVASGANRQYVTLDKIPKNLQHAFVALEDRKFYTHNGIDLAGIARAGMTGILNGLHFSQGASTITQQLLKNNFFSGWTSEVTLQDKIERKIQEQYLAVQLEKELSKEEILENYLNTINLGQNTLGVQAASQRYFSKDVGALTLSESAVIASITQSPTKYNPITHPEENKKRRQKCLDDMLEIEFITQAEYDAAMADNVYERIQILNAELDRSSTSYFVDALCDQLIDDLVNELGYSESEAYRKLYAGGLTIRSTQDPAIQAILDEEINNQDNYGGNPLYSFSYRLTVQKPDGSLENYSEQTMLSYYQSGNKNFNINYKTEEDALAAIEEYKSVVMEEGDIIPEKGEFINITLQPQVAMSIIDQSTGQVPAIIGGRGDKTASRTLNRATGITRQPGSTFKVVASYAAALDAGGMSIGTAIDDAPMTYSNGTSLRNYNGVYRGFTTIRTAITHSINVVAVKTLTEIGTGLGLQYAQDLGITTLEPTDNNQALALGGITYGVKNIDLCAAYATIANSGKYNRPVFYTQVIDYKGDVILDTTDDAPKDVLKPTTAWLLTNAMRDVMTMGTGTAANFSGMTVVGKSGTTTSNRDTVFAGFTPYYTGVIWGGFDDNAKQSSTTYSKVLWRKVMSRIHEGLENKDFERPEGITSATICTKSGKLAIPDVCDRDPRGSMVKSEYFDKNLVPTETCDHHTTLRVCQDSMLPAGPNCPAENIIEGVFIIGGSPDSDDGPYMMSEEITTQFCLVHNNEDGSPNENGEIPITDPHRPDVNVNVTPTQPTPDPPESETPTEPDPEEEEIPTEPDSEEE